MKMLEDIQLSHDDICILQNYSDVVSRKNVDISQEYTCNNTTIKTRNPLIVSPMVHTLTPAMLNSIIHNDMIFTVHRYFERAEDQLNVILEYLGEKTFYQESVPNLFFAVGKCKKWIDCLYEKGVRNMCVDFAHGYSKACIDTVEYIRSLDKNNMIMAGNVETYDGTYALLTVGTNIIRAGLASGSICSTNKNTAIGRPIVSALIDCKKAIDDHERTGMTKKYLIADGGIRGAADIAKAIGIGADFVMCGKLFAATSNALGPFYNHARELTEATVTWCLKKGWWTNGVPHYVEYAGMASHKMRQHNQSHQVNGISIEGESGLIKYTGKTATVINNIEANLRASLSYVGARNWVEFKNRAVFARVSTAGMIEKKTHLDIND
jgi:IMP dehydrogenase/GMP reductase